MMALGFSHRAGVIHKVQGRLEIGKEKGLLQVMAIYHFPIGKLCGQLGKWLAFQRWNSAATGHATLIGEITHPGCPTSCFVSTAPSLKRVLQRELQNTRIAGALNDAKGRRPKIVPRVGEVRMVQQIEELKT